MRRYCWVVLCTLIAGAPVAAAPLTADQAVKIALKHNTQVIGAEAGVLDSKGRLWGAYAGVLPSLSGSVDDSRSRTQWNDQWQPALLMPGSVPGMAKEQLTTSTTTSSGLSSNWSLVNLSNWSAVAAARQGRKAADRSRQATRNDIALEARRRFYEVVKAAHLAGVSAGALKLSRDDERRVRALFEVGSVSKSDLLKARVRTSQSELDSLLADHAVIASRVTLSNLLGVTESDIGEVDTTLTSQHRSFTETEILAEARAARPDLMAAEAGLRAAQGGLTAARLARLPYLFASGSATFKPKTETNATEVFVDTLGRAQTLTGPVPNFDPAVGVRYNLRLSVSMNLFDGFATDSRVASARAGVLRSRETRDALVRNLESEVRLALLGFQESVEREGLARRTLESASENLNLVQQKYNVGSATILDLIDSQVQLQRAQSDLVTAMAAIRVAEATLDRVRGHAE